ncbi:MAG: Ig-like domain-containing protein, partial [Desulfosarcinaceae bacterium]
MKQARGNHGWSFLFLICAISLMVSCGGGGGDDETPAPSPTPSTSSPTPSAILQGLFKDSAVEGLYYQTPSLTGQTNNAGEFKYRDGEQVSFFVGDLNGIKLGQAVVNASDNGGKTVITPIDIVSGAMDVTNPSVTNIARFLQSLDEDGDLDNGIRINDECQSRIASFAKWNLIDFADTVDFEKKMAELFKKLNFAPTVFKDGAPVDRSLTGSSAAQAHLDATLKGPIDQLALRTGASNIVANGTNTVSLRAEVSNSSGDPLIAVPVSFNTTLGSLSAAVALTGADGVARMTLTAGTTTGTAVITAAADGFVKTANVQFTAGAPATVSVTAAPGTVNPE